MAKSIIAIALISFFLLIQNSDAYDTLIVSAGNLSFASTPCTHWTQRSRFTYGDNTVSMYEAEKNSVVQITDEDYIICNATSPVLANNSDSFSVLKLNQRGPSYFISGIVVENRQCKNNETIVIVVITTDGRLPGSPCHRSNKDKAFYVCTIVFGVLLGIEYCWGCGHDCRRLLF